MNRPRLLRLIKILEAVPEGAYNQSTWCGTACCAAGHAAQDRVFRKAGLGIVAGMPHYRGNQHFEALEAFFELTEKQAFYIFGCSPYEHLAMKLHGPDAYKLSVDELTSKYILPRHAIDRIKEILA